MKIGIDGRLWGESGVGRYTRNLVKYLQTIDRENDYVLFVKNKDLVDVKFQIVRADIHWHTVSEQLRFPFVLNKYDLDLVHFPYISVPIFYKKPYVITIHDLIPYHLPTGKASTLPLILYKTKLAGYRFVISQAADRAKAIIAVSEATKQEVVKTLHVPSRKVTVTYEGIDEKIRSAKLADEIQSKFKIPKKKYFLYVGNAYPHKNLERLLEAFTALMKKSPNISLVLVVKDDYFSQRLMRRAEHLKVASFVRFLHDIDDWELSILYRLAKALVAPSLAEGFDLPVVEAMANRCLVVASNIPIHREVAGKAAVYFDPNNTLDLAKKLKAVHLNDRDHYSAQREEGFERIKAFSWEKMAKETLRVYESCLRV